MKSADSSHHSDEIEDVMDPSILSRSFSPSSKMEYYMSNPSSNLSIEYKQSSKPFNMRMKKKLNETLRKNTDLRKIMFTNYITKGVGKKISMPFSLNKKREVDIKNIQHVERIPDEKLQLKLAFYVNPYNKSLLNHSTVNYFDDDNDILFIDEYESEFDKNRDLGNFDSYI
jgi:hypothetical protein